MEDTNKQGLEILDIPPVPIAIKQAAAKGKLVIFVGAGVSRIAGGPSLCF